MNDSLNMYDDFSNVVSNEQSISTQSVLDILKEYSGTISVFDLMAVNAEMIEDSRHRGAVAFARDGREDLLSVIEDEINLGQAVSAAL